MRDDRSIFTIGWLREVLAPLDRMQNLGNGDCYWLLYYFLSRTGVINIDTLCQTTYDKNRKPFTLQAQISSLQTTIRFSSRIPFSRFFVSLSNYVQHSRDSLIRGKCNAHARSCKRRVYRGTKIFHWPKIGVFAVREQILGRQEEVVRIACAWVASGHRVNAKYLLTPCTFAANDLAFFSMHSFRIERLTKFTDELRVPRDARNASGCDIDWNRATITAVEKSTRVDGVLLEYIYALWSWYPMEWLRNCLIREPRVLCQDSIDFNQLEL